MATTTKTWTFDSSAEGWVLTPTGSVTGGFSTAYLYAETTGRNNTNTFYFEWSGNWEQLGVPSGSTVTEVGSGTTNDYDWRCSIATVSNGGTVGPFEFYDNTPSLQGTFSTGNNFSGSTTSWATVNGSSISVPSAIQASNSIIRLRLNGLLNNANDKNAKTQVDYDNISVQITYSAAASPIDGSTNGSTILSAALSGLGSVDGSSNGLSSLFGAISGIGFIDGSTFGSSTLSATLDTGGSIEYIDGSSNGLSTPSGTLTGLGNIYGSTDGITSLSGTISGTGYIDGSVNGLSSLSGIIKGTGYVDGSTNGLSTLSATVIDAGSPQNYIDGSSNGSSLLAASIKGTGYLDGSVNGLSSLSSTLLGIAKIDGSVNGFSALSGYLFGKGNIIGLTAGSTSGSATIKGTGYIDGSVNGSTILAATLTGFNPGLVNIDGSTNGLSTLSATLTGKGYISGLSRPAYTIYDTIYIQQSISGSIKANTLSGKIKRKVT